MLTQSRQRAMESPGSAYFEFLLATQLRHSMKANDIREADAVPGARRRPRRRPWLCINQADHVSARLRVWLAQYRCGTEPARESLFRIVDRARIKIA
jgi:hypothetical protein